MKRHLRLGSLGIAVVHYQQMRFVYQKVEVGDILVDRRMLHIAHKVERRVSVHSRNMTAPHSHKVDKKEEEVDILVVYHMHCTTA